MRKLNIVIIMLGMAIYSAGSPLPVTSLTVPWTETFDQYGMPPGWTMQGLMTNWISSNSNFAGGDACEMRCIPSTQLYVGSFRLCSPPMTTSGMSALYLSFKSVYGASPNTVTITVESSSDGINWTTEAWSVSAGPSPIDASTIYTTITHNLGSATWIAWTLTGNQSNFWQWSIDNVIVSDQPLLPPPEKLRAVTVDATDMNILFTPNSNNNNVVIAWNTTGTFIAPSGEPPSPGSPFAGGFLLYNGTASPAIHSGVTTGSKYYYKAWSRDGSGNYSLLGLTCHATAAPPLALPFTEDFSGTTPPSGFPLGWSQETYINEPGGDLWQIHAYNYAGGTPNEVWFAIYYGFYRGPSRLISRGINTTGVSALYVTFKMHTWTGSCHQKLQSSADGIHWTDEWAGSGCGNWVGKTYDVKAKVTQNLGSVTYLAWTADDESLYYWGEWALDDIQVTDIPPKWPPQAFNLDVKGVSEIDVNFTPAVTGDNVVITWNNSGTFTKPVDGVPPPSPGNAFAGGTLLYNGTSSPVTHSGLSQHTHYYYRAWSVNPGNNYSTPLSADDWTLCPTVTAFPFEEHFSATPPSCWVENSFNPSVDIEYYQSYGNIYFDHTNPGTGYFAIINPSKIYTLTPVQLTTPPLDLTFLNNPCLDFWYWRRTEMPYSENITVDIFAGGSWHNAVGTIPDDDMVTWQRGRIPLSDYKDNNDVRIRFSYNQGANSLGLDDVSVYDLSYCSTPLSQPTDLVLDAGTYYINGAFTPASGGPTNYLVVMSTHTPLVFSPVDFTYYEVGQDLGNDEYIIDNDDNYSFSASWALPSTQWYFYVFSYNNGEDCQGPVYLSQSPLEGNVWTLISDPLSFGVSNPDPPAGYSGMDLSFEPDNGNDVVLVWNTSGIFTAPSGAPPAPGMPFAGGTLLYAGQDSPVHQTGLMTATHYFYIAFSKDAMNHYSSGMSLEGWTRDARACCPQPNDGSFGTATTGVILSWSDVISASGYKVSMGRYPGGTDLLNKAPTSLSAYFLSFNLDPGTAYYWKVYTELPGGLEFAQKEWRFTTHGVSTTIYPFNYDYATGYVKRSGTKFSDPINTFQCPDMKLGFIKFDLTSLDPAANIVWGQFNIYASSSISNNYINLIKPLDADPATTAGDQLFNNGFNHVHLVQISDMGSFPGPKSVVLTKTGIDYLNDRKASGWAGLAIDRFSSDELDYYGYTDPNKPSLNLEYGITSVPLFHAVPEGFDFGEYPMNNFSIEHYTCTFHISNTGSGTLSVTGTTLVGTDAASFILSDVNTYPVSLLHGESLQFDVVFSAQESGSKNANVRVTTTGDINHDLSLTGSAYVNSPMNLTASQGLQYDAALAWSAPLPEGELRYDRGFQEMGLERSDAGVMVCSRFKAPFTGSVSGMSITGISSTQWGSVMLCNDDGTGRPDLALPLYKAVNVPAGDGYPQVTYVPLPVPQDVVSGQVFYVVVQWPDAEGVIAISDDHGEVHSLLSEDYGQTWNSCYDYSAAIRAYMTTPSHLLSYTLNRGFTPDTYRESVPEITGQSYDDISTMPGVKYYYAADAVYTFGTSGHSGEANVTVKQYPMPPTVPHPKYHATNVSPDDYLSWKNNGNVQFVDLYLSMDEAKVMSKDPSVRVLYNHAVTDHYTPPMGFPLGKNFWKVVCKDDDTPQHSAECTGWDFIVPDYPTAITQEATNTGCSIARLNGQVNGYGSSTSVMFDYGLTDAYGSQQAAVPAVVTGNTLTSVIADLAGLSAGSTYHYRVEATNGAGTSYGEDMTFSTSPLPSAAGSISGPASVCQGTKDVHYTIKPITGVLSYSWTVPYGVKITGGNTTTNIKVEFTRDAISGKVTAAGHNACGDGPSSSLDVTVNPLPGRIGDINGPAEVCAGSKGVVYSVTPVPNATSYNWKFPPKMTVTGGSNTATVTVNVSNSIFTGEITVKAVNSCGNSPNTSSLAVHSVTLPGKPSPIHGEKNVCQESSGSYSVNPVDNASGYVWTLPPGVQITDGDNTNSIIVYFSTTAQTGNFTVYATNVCGNGPASNPLNVKVTPLPDAPVITYNPSTNKLSSNAASGNQWYLNGAQIRGANGQTYTPKKSGDYYDIVTLPPSCSSPPSNTIHVTLTKEIGSGTITEGSQDGYELKVSPNPNQGKFRWQIECPGDETFTMEMRNSMGIRVQRMGNVSVSSSGEGMLEIESLPDGIYIFYVYNENAVMTRKIIISK
jgi:hypothetical protein